MKKEIGRVLCQQKLAEGIYDMWVETGIAKEAKPGQFAMLYRRDRSALLPRPISICQIGEDSLRFVYRIAGEGTREFARYGQGDEIALLGPAGNGFPLTDLPEGRVQLMGGGIGIPPMLGLAKALKELGREVDILLGYRDGALFLKEEFEPFGQAYTATEDGSCGTKGNVCDIVREKGLKPSVIMACGPMPMLKAIKSLAGEMGIPSYISLEERMACGVGACLGCVCKTTKKDHHSHVNNARICTDGPVFLGEDVDL